MLNVFVILGNIAAGYRVVTSVTMLYCDCQDLHGVVRIRQQILRAFSHFDRFDRLQNKSQICYLLNVILKVLQL